MKFTINLVIIMSSIAFASLASAQQQAALGVDKLAYQTSVDTVDIATAYFATNRANLSAAAIAALEPLIKRRRHSIKHCFNVVAYADARGSQNTNLTLSLRRAKVVKDYLIERGVHPDRINLTALGESRAAINVLDTGNLIQDRKVQIFVNEVFDASSRPLALGN